jgi:hypothetical protein
LPVFQLGIQVCVLGRHLCLGNQRHLFVGEVLEAHDAPVSPLEPVVFLRRQQHQLVTPVAGDGRSRPIRCAR